MRNGTLAQWRKKENLPISEIEERMLEVAQGIQYIHSEGVVHGDLRGANVLLDDDFHVQIADFGLTRISEATATQSGTLHYNFAAPELFGSSSETDLPDLDPINRTKMSDVFAFGCLYYEIHYDTMPFARRKEIQIMKLVCAGDRPPRLDEPPLCDRAWHLIQWCWESEASMRPAIENVTKSMEDSDFHIPPAKKIERNRVIKGFGLILSMLILHFFASFLSTDYFTTVTQINTQCGQPLTTIEDWHVKAFRPKWFGLIGEPAPIIYRTPFRLKAHQISVVDLDKRDIEIQIWVDKEYMGSRDIELNSTVDCGDDIGKCIELEFATALLVVPPGRHAVRAEIRKREYSSISSFQFSNGMSGNASEAFVWGKERQRRVMWMVQQCH
ncbi:hypothetical protein AX14_004845 [Amanita brunnescens Koide BX004]|nr:hypothetical protein AX14_004845 [Amanita brunnescens Koide BX004]